MQESPIFSKTYDLLLWLIPATTKFPREQRFVLARAVQESALHFQDALIDAALSSKQSRQLEQQQRFSVRRPHRIQLIIPAMPRVNENSLTPAEDLSDGVTGSRLDAPHPGTYRKASLLEVTFSGETLSEALFNGQWSMVNGAMGNFLPLTIDNRQLTIDH